MSTTDTVIEFVGLCVFTTQLLTAPATRPASNRIASKGGDVVVAIMPRVPGQKTPAAPVETHTAMIAFKRSDLLSANGWAVKQLDRKGWVYVELSGDQVRFVADAPNAAVTPTPANLLLHHLGLTLTSAYKPPKYPGAAAVFTISNGSLSVCANGGSPPRIDTTLVLHTLHQVILATAGANKRLILRAGARVIAANLPLAFAKTGIDPNPHNHYTVYCAMVGDGNCIAPTGPVVNTTCDFQFPPAALAARRPPLPSIQSVDFACSNTQWP